MSTEVTTTQKQAVAKPTDLAKGFLNDPQLKEQLKLACAKHMTPDRVARIALTAVLSSPKLGECFMTPQGKASVARSLMTATQRGVEVDGRQAHLVPFRCKLPGGGFAMQAQLIMGYQGLIDLAYRHPLVAAIWVEAVYEKDTFVHAKGLNPTLEHVPYDGDEDSGKLVATYAVCEMKNGAKVFIVLRKREIDRIKAFSRGAADADSPWKSHEEAMWKKSAVRALTKIIPQSSELRDALSEEDEFERGRDTGITIKQAQVVSTTHTAAAASEMLGGPVVMEAATAAEAVETTKLNPIKTELIDFVVGPCASNFDNFVQLAVREGWLDADSPASTFDELPEDTCKQALAKKKYVQSEILKVR